MRPAAERLLELAAWQDEWTRKWAHTVPEGVDGFDREPDSVVDMTASQEAQDNYWREASRILDS